jgi:AcrR family transcriptional regulator
MPAPISAPEAETTSGPGISDAAPVVRRGRPRCDDRDLTILDAATALLQEIGYDRLRIQDVADRAHVGLATIYRRWPTKQALVIAVMQHAAATKPSLETDDPRADLRALLAALVGDLSGPRCNFMSGFLTAVRTDPELGHAFRTSVLDNQRERLRRPIARIVGEDDPELELRVDLAPAIMMFRVLIGDEFTDAGDTVRQLEALILSGR